MPRDRQTSLFSATFPSEIQQLAKDFLRDYIWIGVGRVGSTVKNISQRIIHTSADPREKLSLLIDAIGQTDGRTLVFVRRKQTAVSLTQALRSLSVPVDEIHGA
jgi:ATP-dependent RNA helicase DDX3X